MKKLDSSNFTVEICEDMACVIFNETSYSITKVVRNETDYTLKELKSKKHPLCLHERHDITYGEKYWLMTFERKPWLEGCDRF